jgi:tetratricopeptide (TPR) repeat protein
MRLQGAGRPEVGSDPDERLPPERKIRRLPDRSDIRRRAAGFVSSAVGDGRDNLPAPLTSFEGREQDVAEVAQLLEAERLVTLVGAPGVGKTRLALRVAAEVLGSFSDGVWLAELAPLSEATLVPAAVARDLGLGADANRPMVDVLTEYLHRRRILIVLDNCEHLLDAAARYHLLETIRQYAAVTLRQAGEESTFRDRRRDWFLALVERAEPRLVGPEQVRWLDALEADHGNVRAALRCCLHTHNVNSGLRFGRALWRFWEGRNHLAEGRAWLDELLARGAPLPGSILECRAKYAAGRMALLQGDGESARRHFERCLAPSRELGDLDLFAVILTQLGHLSRERGDLAEARSRYEASDRIWRELGDARGIALSLLSLGRLALVEGAIEEGMTLGEESLRRYRELGDPTDVSRVLLFVGGAACDLGRLDEARAYYTEGLRVAASLRDRGRLCASLGGFGER